MYCELSKLEAEIAKELDQSIPGTAKQPDRKKQPNLDCLSNPEIDVMTMINSKVAAFNPWIRIKWLGKLSEEVIAKAEAMVTVMWNERSHYYEPGEEPPVPPVCRYKKNLKAMQKAQATGA